MSFKEELQSAAEDDRLVVGTSETIKQMDDLERVIVAGNAPAELADRVRDAADGTDLDVEVFDGTNQELGSLCRKPFAASTVGIKKVTGIK
ncbi:MAG: ribosomal L7Ae/L30e/S12e/Gadd45 family protein [Candidatus Nanohaloarchaea archaeon]|nr:ribosomal L7Ae/L30e/S12e/Gadd45 family protein [Candidatus Nanohaloarchaea archaeon]